ASLALCAPGGHKYAEFDRETLRHEFRRWIEEALRLRPTSIKDLYRLGVFEAQVEAQHDKPALCAFLKAIECYDSLSDAEKAQRGDLRKTRSKALYAAARSALRLHNVALARKLSFACIRVDKDADDVAPAARLALDGQGPPRRDYIFGLLSDIALERGDASAAAAWIEAHVKEHRRDSALWRRLGDARKIAGNVDGAIAAYEASLVKDRCGRHLTYCRLGRIHLERKELGRAEDAFRKASEFCRKTYATESETALQSLAQVLEARGKHEEAQHLGPRLAKARAREPQHHQGVVA
ncbi:MAG: hypothetical protein WCI05_17180, partial [Myxococcales bacterium]